MSMKKLLNITIIPYIAYSIINTIIIILSVKNVGILNDDIATGLFFSWCIYLVVYIICNSINATIKE